MPSDVDNFPCFVPSLTHHVWSARKGVQLQGAGLNTRRYSLPTERKNRTCAVAMNVSGDVSTSTSSERVLWADGLTKSHDGKRILLQDVSLTLARGQKVGLLGSNGSCSKLISLEMLQFLTFSLFREWKKYSSTHPCRE